MGDGLFLGTVNFGPLKQAISTKARHRGAILDAAQTGLKIFDLVQDTKFSEFQGKYSDLYADYKSKMIAAVENGELVPDENGQIVYDSPLLGDPSQGMIGSQAKNLKEDFLEQVEGMSGDYRRDKKVKRFVQSTAREAANVVTLEAQQAIVRKYSRQREANFSDRSFPQAVQQSIAQMSHGPLRDLIMASDWLGSERQNQLMEIGISGYHVAGHQ